jgi:hypothetical protein
VERKIDGVALLGAIEAQDRHPVFNVDLEMMLVSELLIVHEATPLDYGTAILPPSIAYARGTKHGTAIL